MVGRLSRFLLGPGATWQVRLLLVSGCARVYHWNHLSGDLRLEIFSMENRVFPTENVAKMRGSFQIAATKDKMFKMCLGFGAPYRYMWVIEINLIPHLSIKSHCLPYNLTCYIMFMNQNVPITNGPRLKLLILPSSNLKPR